jgi:energy-coupling factor transporter ATP-binding protein EcfA2
LSGPEPFSALELGAGQQQPPIPAFYREAALTFVGRRWMLRRVADWLAWGTERVFLVTGDPGSGKSTLCAWLAGAGPGTEDPQAAVELQAIRNAWSAVHFCTSKGPGGSVDPSRFTRSIAEQLATRHPAFGEFVIRSTAPELSVHVDVKENWGQVVGVRAQNLIVTGISPASVYSIAVREPLHALLERFPDLRVPILVDGLDEALVEGSPNIVQLLASDSDLPAGVRFFLTSRNERRVTEAFTSRFQDLIRVDLSTGEAAELNRADIQEFITRRVADPALSGQLDAGIAPQSIAGQFARQAVGNFLYAQVLLAGVAAGRRQSRAASGLPGELFDLYRADLNRLMPDMEQYGRSDTWLQHYQPLLGLISVATPAAPAAVLPRWLDWDESEVLGRIDDLSQIIKFEAVDGGAFRLYHTSMADFLAAPRHAGGEPNRYYVAPWQQHDRIARYYLASADEQEGSWSRCDEYGLRQVVGHMRGRLEGATPGRQAQQWRHELYSLAREPSFQTAQRDLADGTEVVVAGSRAALDVALANGDLDEVGRLIDDLATSMDLGLRGLAVESLVKLHALEPRAAIERITWLLGREAMHVWGVGLKAAYLIGPGAQEVFHWIALSGSAELRQAASCALCLRWNPGRGDFTLELLEGLARQVSLTRLRRSYQIASFVADVTVNIYINHCDQVELAYRLSNLCHMMLRQQLHLNIVNQPFLERALVSPAVVNTLAARALDATLASELQDPAHIFAASQDEKERFRAVIPLFDPERELHPHVEQLGALLQSEIVLHRILAALVLGAHACHDFPSTVPILEGLFDRMGARGRLWELIAFTVLLPTTPPAWIPLLESLTSRFIHEERTAFVDRGWETLAKFDVALLPLGLAYGKRGERMTFFEQTIRAATDQGDLLLVSRCIEGLGLVGFYYPQALFNLLEDTITDWSNQALRPSLVQALSLVRTLHFDRVDLFLRQVGAEHLAGEIAARSDIDMVRGYVDRVGFFNYSVNICLHYPERYRAAVLDSSFLLLAEVRDQRELLRRYAPIVLRLLREADYQPIRWEGREP